jgi:hypothetical protein
VENYPNGHMVWARNNKIIEKKEKIRQEGKG